MNRTVTNLGRETLLHAKNRFLLSITESDTNGRLSELRAELRAG